MERTLKNLMTMGAVFVVTGFGLPALPASAMATGDADKCLVVAELWDGSSGYMETDFASVTGARDDLRPVVIVGLWDGSSDYMETDLAFVTGAIEGLPPAPVAGLWDGNEGTSEPMVFASAIARGDSAPSSPVVTQKSHTTPCGMTS